MPPSGFARMLDAAVLLLGALMVAAVLLTVRLLPAADLAAAGLDSLRPALAAALLVGASSVAVGALARGLRGGRPAVLLGAPAAAGVAGGALVLTLAGTAGGLRTALPITGALLVAVALNGNGNAALAGRGPRLLAAVGGLVVAGLAVAFGVAPGTAAVTALWHGAMLAVAGVAALLAAVISRERWLAAACAATALGVVGVGLDRGTGLELIIGLLSLIAASIAALRSGVDEPPAARVVDPSAELPALAQHLDDAVLRFDGGLRLRDWNPAARALLALDPASGGARLEDLLGVPMAELPPDGGTATSAVGVGGLEVRLYRAGDGVIAIVAAAPGRGDEERLGRELRGTIEELLAARRTIELQRAEVERSSTVDLLTGVASRASIIDRLRLEIAQARRYQHPVAVVLLDVDDLAAVNHRHGVAGGDAVLREVALRMRLRVREADALGRSGSDGFLAILPHTDEAGAATFAAALRHRLAQRPVAVGDELVPVTVSVGVAVMRAGEDLDLDGLLERAGEALDSARMAGGDRIALDRMHGLARLEDPDRRNGEPPATAQDSGQ